MNYAYCWHRPGRVLRGEIRACRHCGVAIEECPCVVLHRNVMPGCTACEGSGWVGILRSKAATFAAALFDSQVDAVIEVRMIADDYDRTDPANWFDHEYWGPGGVDISQWGPQCTLGLRYRDYAEIFCAGVDDAAQLLRRDLAEHVYQHQRAQEARTL